MIAGAEKDASEVALLVVGLDGFQHINDMLGHACGDRVLCAVSERLNAQIGGAGIVARLSGDEFAIAIRCAELSETAAQLAERIALAFDTPLATAGRQHRVKVSIGAAIYPGDGRTAEELLSNSHLAFCRAKATKRGGHVVFEGAIRRELESRLTLEAELALAAERNEFELFYQPQVRLSDGGLIGAEALIRWRHPVLGLVSPAEFMPVVNTLPFRIGSRDGFSKPPAGRRGPGAGRHNSHRRQSFAFAASVGRSRNLGCEALDITGLTPALLDSR
jgi:diguanylate cyclase (GGDEF)-like protein